MVVLIEESTAIMEKRKNKRRKSEGNDNGLQKAPPTKAPPITSSIPPLLDGMSSAEVMMIRKLAGNDGGVRKKTMRKLRKWLTVIVLKFPDDSDSRTDIEPNLIRVWKALFYCMWMADKPLPQEQLAEQISNLVQVFGIKTNVFLIFVEWFYRTMAREWSWIDRYRLDKFMMLCRRFLRQTLLTMSSRKWNSDMLDGFIKILRVYVFNHHPTKKLQKGIVSPPETVVVCPVGLQIHIIDVFLEELAKAGSNGLKSGKVLKLLSPFIKEMATNSDDRVTEVIKERIFHHLMKQSDVGIDYAESLMGQEEEEEEEEENGIEDDGSDMENEDSSEENEGGGEDEVFEVDDGPMDPRAGAVDVFLPQIELDYNILVEKLTAAGGEKAVKKRNRGKLYSLAASFKDLTQGKYPLALPEQERWKPAIPQKELNKAAQRMLDLEIKEREEDGVKVRMTKKQRRRAAKRLQQQEQLDDTLGSEDRSAFLNDEDLIDHVSDNYASYVHEQMDKPLFPEDEDEMDTPRKKKVKKRNVEDMDCGEIEPKPKKKKYKTVIEFESGETNQELSVSVDQKNQINEEIVITKPKKSRKSFTITTGENDDTVKKAKKNRGTKSLSPNSTMDFKTSSLGKALTDMKIQRNALKNMSPTKVTPLLGKKNARKSFGGLATPNSEARRRINFVLAKNMEHEATDYMPSISKSPQIPFDACKTPTSGILKTVRETHSLKGMLSPLARKSFGGTKTSPRKRALDFFGIE